MLIALLAGLLLAPGAGARTVVQSDTARDPRLAGTSLVWMEGNTLVRRRAGGRVSRIVVPPGPTRLVDASATHLVLDRTHTEACRPAPGGAEYCPLREELWAGPLDGPFTPLTAASACPGARLLSRTDLDGGAVAVVEYLGRCGAPDHRYAVARVDLASGARRTIARLPRDPWAVRIAGDWIAWWSWRPPSGDEIAVWRSGDVRRRIASARLGVHHIDAWDLQADGTVVAVARPGARTSGRLFVSRAGDGGGPRRLVARISQFTQNLQVARDRIAAFAGDGRLVVTDLAGRPRAVRGAPGPRASLTDFDGRRGVWLRDKALVEPTFCPVAYPDPPPEPCEPEPGRFRHWIVSDRIAR